jgi:serine/threonine protein kinase
MSAPHPSEPIGGAGRASGGDLHAPSQASDAGRAPDRAGPVSPSAEAALGPYRLLTAIVPPRIDDPERPHIWLAEAGQGRKLVLKLYRVSVRTPMALRRVERESRTALRCAHLPGLVTTEFAGPIGDWWVIAMERLGPTLVAHHRERRMHPGRWRNAATYALWIEQIARSLGDMHRAGHVHGDIKTPNVMLDWDRSMAKLGDFSRARPYDLDRASNDQLQLAHVAWILLTGRKYPEDPQHRLSAPLREVLVRATAPSPRQRFPDMHSFAEAIRAAPTRSGLAAWARHSRLRGRRRLGRLLRRS